MTGRASGFRTAFHKLATMNLGHDVFKGDILLSYQLSTGNNKLLDGFKLINTQFVGSFIVLRLNQEGAR